jgi:nucleotide-binding universal stress UspA family protein
MQTFLVPVDFSPASDNALAYAAQLAQQTGARLLLLHAYMLPTPVSEVPYVMVTADELQKENEILITQAAEKLVKDYPVDLNWTVRLGIASDEVKAITRDQQIDLVIMGMKGAGGIEKIIGSTTTNVIHKISKPVLIVPHDTSFRPLKHIVYASDFSYPANAELFTPLLRLASQFDAHINILHIQSGHAPDTEEVEGKRIVESLFHQQPHSFVTRQDSSVKHGINEFLGNNPGDLLVMVAHKHTFFERLFSKGHTTAMAYQTHIPMLVLPETA